MLIGEFYARARRGFPSPEAHAWKASPPATCPPPHRNPPARRFFSSWRTRWTSRKAAPQHANGNPKQESTHGPACNARNATARHLFSVLMRCTAATRPRQRGRRGRRSARQGQRASPRPCAPPVALPGVPMRHRRRPPVVRPTEPERLPAGYAVTRTPTPTEGASGTSEAGRVATSPWLGPAGAAERAPSAGRRFAFVPNSYPTAQKQKGRFVRTGLSA